mmetsp:Transcript_4291/g.13537  ORF Transcript_4291/g.13537 Transcript_4291/m.13537 type:complete len:272 (-) Transcript_4291:1603-2418(-)
MDDVVVARPRGALEAVLRHHVPVLAVGADDVAVDHRARLHLRVVLLREARLGALLHDDDRQLGRRHLLECACLIDLAALDAEQLVELVVRHTVAVEEDALRRHLVRAGEGAQARAHLVDEPGDLLARALCADRGERLGALRVHHRHERGVRGLGRARLRVVDVVAHHHRRLLAQQREAALGRREDAVGAAKLEVELEQHARVVLGRGEEPAHRLAGPALHALRRDVRDRVRPALDRRVELLGVLRDVGADDAEDPADARALALLEHLDVRV